MAKASLNMITRTCGKYYKKSGIVMCSVDTWWNNRMEPLRGDEDSPLNCEDGAARILDPIFRDLHASGVFYRNFCRTSW